jgi:hypothetical protein
MSCEKGPNKIARLAGQISAGITQVANKAAYYAGANSPRRASELATLTRQVALVGAMGAGAILAIRAVRQRRRQDSRGLTGSATYIEGGFDLEAGQALTDEFGGACLSEPALRTALGPGSVSKPVLKLSGEDDVLLGEGPNGHVYYSLPDDGLARVAAVVPRQGRDRELGQALDAATPKYVMTDLMAGEEYVTRDPEEARRFSLALGKAGLADLLQPGDEAWDKARKPIPPALFA